MAKSKNRNYKKEYVNYQGKPEQIKRRAARNKAHAMMEKAGKVTPGEDVHHMDGNPLDDKMGNLKAKPKSKNRSYARTKTAGKKNAKS